MVTFSLPGLIVSAESRVKRPLTVTVTCVLWPASSVPDDCETLTLPSRPDGTEIDQFTVPPVAVSVIVELPAPASVIVDGDTLSVPAATPPEADGLALGEGDAEGELDGEEPPDDPSDADADADGDAEADFEDEDDDPADADADADGET